MRRLASLMVILVSAFVAFPQSFDLSINTDATAVQTDTLYGEVSQEAVVGLKLPLGKRWRLSTNLGASVVLSGDSVNDDLEVWYPGTAGDADLRELSLVFGAPLKDEGLELFSLALGRFAFSDPSSQVYAYRIDGLSVRATYPLVVLRAVVGYTGFLPGDATLIPSLADNAYGNDSFAPPRAIASFSIRTKRFIGNELYAAFLAQHDLRDASDYASEYATESEAGGQSPSNGGYLAVGLSGPSTGVFSYSAFGVYQVGKTLSKYADELSGYSYQYAPIRAFLLGGTTRLSLSSRLQLSARVQYGSGDSDVTSYHECNTEGDATLFVPMTTSTTGIVFSPDPGNVSYASLGITARPLPPQRIGLGSLTLIGKTFAFVKNGEGPISEAGVTSSTGFALLGFEQDVTAMVQILSDTRLTASIGVFAPWAEKVGGAFDDSYVKKSPIRCTATAGLSIAL